MTSHSLTSLRRFYNAVMDEPCDEFLAILNRLPDDGSGGGVGRDSSPGSDPSNDEAPLSISFASFCQPKDAVPSPTVASATCSERIDLRRVS